MTRGGCFEVLVEVSRGDRRNLYVAETFVRTARYWYFSRNATSKDYSPLDEP